MPLKSTATIQRSAQSIPTQWVGVKADWQVLGDPYWEHLVSVTPQQLSTHALLIGATGSGKTNLLHHLIAQDIERGQSLCVLDLRGDLVASVLELCSGRVDPRNVCLIDLREKTRPTGFCPLYGEGEPYFRALNVLDVLEAESESWGVQLSETVRNALMLLAEAGQPMTLLEAVFYDRRFRLDCLEAVQTDSVAAFWHRFDSMSADKQSAFAGPVLNKVSLLFATPALRKTLGSRCPVDLGRHLNTSGSVTLVSLAADELHGAGRMMGSLVLSAICREVFARVGTSEKGRNCVRLYVDEFEHFGVRDFEAILAEGRRFGLSLVLAHQTLAQLSPRMRSMILANVGLKFAFRCGREDSATMSRDYTGDARALDFADLPVGNALMWRRGAGVVQVEVNGPMFRDVGLVSEDARNFLSEVYDAAGSLPRLARTVRTPDEVLRISPVKPVREAPIEAPLEDWLCG